MAKTAADATAELPALLAQWDEAQPAKVVRAANGSAEPDESNGVDAREGLPPGALEETPTEFSEFAEFDKRIAALEAEKADLSSKYESVRDLGTFVDAAFDRTDRFDFARAVDRIEGETALSRRSIELEIKERLREDPEFFAAADARYDDDNSAARFEGLFEEMLDELRESHPKNASGGLRSAVLAARDAPSAPVDDYGNIGRMGNAEFEQVKKKVFDAAKSGRLRSPRGRGGFFSTTP